MTRTNIDIDDELIAAVMADYHVRTKREAVDLALRLARRPKALEPDEILAMFGTNFIDPEFDLDSIRATRVFGPPTPDARSA